MGDSRDGWMRGGSWWDERIREIRSSSPYKAREDEVERHRRSRSWRVMSKSPPPVSAARTQPPSSVSPERPKRATSPTSVGGGWDSGRARRDSQAWKDMLYMTASEDGGSSIGGVGSGQAQRTSPAQQHVKAVLKKVQTGWLGLRKVLSTQARAANVDQIEDFSIGFDDFAAAVETAGISATRMQLAAVFALIDSDTCGIITLQELVAYMRGEGFRVSAFRLKATARETDKARRALSEIFDHVVEVMVCWDLHGNNSTTLIDIGRGLRLLKIKGLDVNKVISEAAADVTLTDGALHLKDFVRHFTWHPLEPLPELVARYDKTKLQRAVVMGKVRAWKARQHPDHIDPDLGMVCCKLRSKWGTISSMFNAVHAAGFERRSSGGACTCLLRVCMFALDLCTHTNESSKTRKRACAFDPRLRAPPRIAQGPCRCRMTRHAKTCDMWQARCGMCATTPAPSKNRRTHARTHARSHARTHANTRAHTQTQRKGPSA